jgi:hypothetical protein
MPGPRSNNLQLHGAPPLNALFLHRASDSQDSVIDVTWVDRVQEDLGQARDS